MGDGGDGGGDRTLLLLRLRVLLVGGWDGVIWDGPGGLVRKRKSLKSIAYQENL